ncbi:MAG: MMPL family transporter [Pseudomarimonas sp.]
MTPNHVPQTWHRRLCLLVWLCVLAATGAWVSEGLRISGDLREFLPAPQTSNQRLLMQQAGEGPGSRLLLLALAGGSPDDLAQHSRDLRDMLAHAPELVWVSNGEEDLDAVPLALQDYRYLLSPGPAEGSLSATGLRQALQQRLQDLASPAAAVVAPLIARDPTMEALRLVEAWTPAQEPARHDGVWMSADSQSALLLVQTRAAGFDPTGQQAALARLRNSHAELLSDAGTSSPAPTLEISGPGAFAERMAEQTRGEASTYGGIASLAMLLLLALAYRSIRLPWLAALPLASGALAGLAATTIVFGDVHGITLAFGFTLLGVAQDYPVHLLSHRQPRTLTRDTARAIWPTLAAGAGSSCIAYLIFLFAGVSALQQLAVFTVVGLATAALATRYGMPHVLADTRFDVAEQRLPKLIQARFLQRRLPRWPAGILAAVCAAVIVFGAAPWWNDNLASLTPVPADLLQRDALLRAELGAPDVRLLLVLRGADVEQVLQRSEAISEELDHLVATHVVDGIDYAARYLPSASTQLARQAQLPDAATLQSNLQQALIDLPFKPNAFDGFVAAVAQARDLPALTPSGLVDTPLALRIESLLQTDAAAEPAADTLALFMLSGIQKPEALATWAATHADMNLVDLKETAQVLAAEWRVRVLNAVAAAALLLLLSMRFALGSWQRCFRVLLPVSLGTACVIAALHALAIPLTLFHLVSLVLATGIGVDYALFFERAGDDAVDQRRTLHAVVICSISTLLVFALLALSEIPVLRAIGLTVALSVVPHVLLSVWLATTPSKPGAEASA